MTKIIGATVGTPISHSKIEKELQPVKTVNGIGPDEKGNVNIPGLGGSPVYLVTISDTDQAQQTYGDIMAAYQAGYVLQCDYRGNLLPLKAILDGEFIFSGTIGITSYHVYVRTNGRVIVTQQTLAQKKEIPTKTSDLENDSGFVSEALLYTPQELTEEQKTQVKENLGLKDLSAGGSNVFDITDTTPNDVITWSINLPTTWDKIKIMSIHINFGALETGFKLFGDLGGYTRAFGEIKTGGEVGVNISLVKNTYGRMGCHYVTNTNAHPAAGVSLTSPAVAFVGTSDLFAVDSQGAAMPAGTTFEIWGVYES